MINSGKVNDPNKFAKKLVEQRIAANLQDAMEKISGYDEFIEEEKVIEEPEKVEEEEEMPEPEAKETEVKEEIKEEVEEPIASVDDSRLERIEDDMKKLSDFMNSIKETMNRNFKEIDERLSQMKKMAASAPAKEEKSESSKQAAKKPADKKVGHPKCDPSNYSEDEVSVENIFSNAHGRLQKKK